MINLLRPLCEVLICNSWDELPPSAKRVLMPTPRRASMTSELRARVTAFLSSGRSLSESFNLATERVREEKNESARNK